MKRILISLIIGAVILALVIQTSNISDLSVNITEASPALVLLSFTIIVGFLVIRSIRWKIILGQGSFINLFSILQIGNLLANILPFHLNEPVRAILLKEKENIPVGYGLSSILIERLMDVVGLLFIGIIVSFLFYTESLVQSWIFQLASNALILAAIATAILIFFVIKPKLFIKIFSPFKNHRYLKKIYTKLENLIMDLAFGLKEMGKKPVNMASSFLITLLMWMVNFISVYILFISIGFEIEPLVILFGFVGTTLGMVLPQSPGYIGTFEVIWIGAFATLGYVNNSEILAVGILYHVLILVSSSVLGIIGMALMRLSIRDILLSSKKKT